MNTAAMTPDAARPAHDAQVDPPHQTAVAGFDQISDDRRDDEQGLQSLADQDQERLTERAGDQACEPADLAAGTAVQRCGVLDEHRLQLVDMGFRIRGVSGDHGLTAFLERAFHLGDAAAADGVHHVLLEPQLFVVLVVGLIDEFRASLPVSGFAGGQRIVEHGHHFRGNIRPGAGADALVLVHLGGIQRLAFLGGLFLAHPRVVARIAQFTVPIQRGAAFPDIVGERVAQGLDVGPAILLVDEALQILELPALVLVSVRADGVVDDLGEVGGHVVGVVCDVERGGRACVVAVNVFGDACVEVRDDCLGDLRP